MSHDYEYGIAYGKLKPENCLEPAESPLLRAEQRLERAIEMADAALRRQCLINEAAVLELALAAWKEVR